MKALILNGDDEASAGGVLGLLRAALNARGWECEVIHLRGMDIRPCTGCFGCWVRTPGRCLQRDDADAVLQAQVRSGLLAFVSSIRWGSYSPELKKMMERSIPILLPFFERYQGETHHSMRYPRQPKFIAIGISSNPSGGDEAVFRKSTARNLLNFRSPAAGIAVLDRNRPEEHKGRIRACLGEAGEEVGL